MTDDEIKQVAHHLHAMLRAEQALHWIEPETHAEQHAYIQQWMKARIARKAAWARIRESVIGWLVIFVIGGALGFIGTAVYRYVAALLLRQN